MRCMVLALQPTPASERLQNGPDVEEQRGGRLSPLLSLGGPFAGSATGWRFLQKGTHRLRESLGGGGLGSEWALPWLHQTHCQDNNRKKPQISFQGSPKCRSTYLVNMKSYIWSCTITLGLLYRFWSFTFSLFRDCWFKNCKVNGCDFDLFIWHFKIPL